MTDSPERLRGALADRYRVEVSVEGVLGDPPLLVRSEGRRKIRTKPKSMKPAKAGED